MEIMTEIVRYKEWAFEVDRQYNENLYEKVEQGLANECDCEMCREFLKIRNDLYPAEIKKLFEKLGVDINKECEFTDFGDRENGHIYSWLFTFSGKIFEGNDCKRKPGILELTKIDEMFSIGFSTDISLSFFKDDNLVEIECTAEMPFK